MRIGDARAARLVFVATLVACAGGAAPGPEATSTQSASAAAPGEGAGSSSVAAPPRAPEDPSAEEPAREETGAREAAPDPPAEPSPTYFTHVSFDLRSLPHRGPRDVDPRLVSGRVELLVQRVRETAGEPPPRVLVYPGASVFRAEFFGAEGGALSQCQRAVGAVAALRDVGATPCARIEP